MKITFQFLSLIVFLLFINSTNTWAQEERSLSYFDEIVVTGNMEVILEQGDEEKVLIYAEGIDTDEIKTSVKGGFLKVSVLKSLITKDEHIRVRVFFRQLKRIRVQTGAQLSAVKRLEIDNLYVQGTNGAKINLEVQVDALDLSVSKGAEAKLQGKTKSFDARAVSGGKLFALELDSDHTYVTATTGGLAKVVANQSLEASANTGGKIEYKGDPEKTKTKGLLTGKIKKL